MYKLKYTYLTHNLFLFQLEFSIIIIITVHIKKLIFLSYIYMIYKNIYTINMGKQ